MTNPEISVSFPKCRAQVLWRCQRRIVSWRLLLSYFLLASSARAADRPFLQQLFDSFKTADIKYGEGATTGGAVDLLLDKYEPVMRPGGPAVPTIRPGYIWIHGGGFQFGDKNGGLNSAVPEVLARFGYVGVSINYRLDRDNPISTPQNLTPVRDVGDFDVAIGAAIEDLAKAIRWMKTNAASLGVDPDRIAIGGCSAGGIAALFTGFGELGADVEIRAITNFWGGLYGNEDLIDAGDPPVLSVHGTIDPTVPFFLSELIEARAKQVGVPSEFYPGFNLEHSWDIFFSPVGESTHFRRMTTFLYQHMDLEGLVLTGGDWPTNAFAGGFYAAEAQGFTTQIQLDGTDSTGAGGTRNFAWRTTRIGTFFDDATSATPVLNVVTLDMGRGIVFNVNLTVTDGASTFEATTQVLVEDRTPPTIDVDTTPINVDHSGNVMAASVSLPVATSSDLTDSGPHLNPNPFLKHTFEGFADGTLLTRQIPGIRIEGGRISTDPVLTGDTFPTWFDRTIGNLTPAPRNTLNGSSIAGPLTVTFDAPASHVSFRRTSSTGFLLDIDLFDDEDESLGTETFDMSGSVGASEVHTLAAGGIKRMVLSTPGPSLFGFRIDDLCFSFDAYPVGTWPVIYQSEDDAGNVARETVEVRVIRSNGAATWMNYR